MKIGKWTVIYNPKPIPILSHDYDVVHDDYDGDNGLYFTAGCMDEIRDEIKERGVNE